MIQVNDLSFSSGKNKLPCLTICWIFRRNYLGILGKNGSKTTLLRLISSYFIPKRKQQQDSQLESLVANDQFRCLQISFMFRKNTCFRVVIYKFVDLNAFLSKLGSTKFIEIASDFELGGNHQNQELCLSVRKNS